MMPYDSEKALLRLMNRGKRLGRQPRIKDTVIDIPLLSEPFILRIDDEPLDIDDELELLPDIDNIIPDF